MLIIAARRLRNLVLLLAATAMIATGCGQKPHVHLAAVESALPLPVECEGDAFHCDVVTSYRGVNVYRNTAPTGFCSRHSCAHPRNRYGTRWQCVELFNRFFATQFGTEPVGGHAKDLFTNAAAVPGLEVRPNGGEHPPAAGDAIVLVGTPTGHVAIIVELAATQVHVVEQNGSADGSNSFSYDPDTNTVVAPAPAAVLGWIHAVANEAPAT